MVKKRVKKRDINSVLSSHYYNINSNTAYGGLNQLYSKVKNLFSKTEVKDWLSNQLSYSLYKDVKRKFPRRNMYTIKPNYNYQIDIAEMGKYSKYNDNYKYFLLVIDIFSRVIDTRPLKSKNTIEVSDAMESILEPTGKTKKKIQSDRGGEFTSAHFKSMLKKHNIELFHTENYTIKAAYAERAIRSLKNRIFSYLTANNTYRWIEALPKLTKAYNNTYHTSIKTTPYSVNEENVEETFHNSWEDKPTRKKLLKVGDYVRLIEIHKLFDKGFYPKWSDEYFIIESIVTKYPPTYTVKDSREKSIIGTFYTDELQKIPKIPDVYRIERIIKRDENGKILVKWYGYPESENEWVDENLYKHGVRIK